MDNSKPDQLWMLLGEIRADLKHLLATNDGIRRRLDRHAEEQAEIEKRISLIEKWKVKVATMIGGLSIFVPASVTAFFQYMGWI